MLNEGIGDEEGEKNFNRYAMEVKPLRWVVLFGGAGREICIEQMLKSGIQIAAVLVPTKRDQKLEDSVKRLKESPLEIIEVSKDTTKTVARAFPGAALLSIGFPFVLSDHVLGMFKLAINLHPTLLPKYRGPTTGAYVIINREKVTGSTVHLMTPQVDRGPIYKQNTVVINSFDTIRSLQRKVYQEEPNLLIAALKEIEAGIEPIPQIESEASEYLAKRKPSDSEINPQKPLIELFHEIRACDPNDFPAHFFFQGEQVNIVLWRPNKPISESDMI